LEIEVMDFEFKTVDNDILYYKNYKYGNLIAVDKRNKIPQNLGESKEIVSSRYIVYRDIIAQLDKLFLLGLAKNMIRPQSNLSDVYFFLRFYMPKNGNG